MFERFTDQAQRVMVLAQDEARTLRHDYIGTEHLLLGLVREDEGVAGKALKSLGLCLESVRQQVVEVAGQGQQAPSGHIPLTPRAKKVLQLALREALQLGHHSIGTEHILLGLVREGGGVAAEVLAVLNVELNPVRQRVILLLHGTQGRAAPGTGRVSRLPGRAGRRQRGLLPEILDRVESIDAQLSALGQGVAAGPDAVDLHQQIAQARYGKEAAARVEDYEGAAEWRDRERQLLAERASRQQEWVSTHQDLAPLAEALQRLGDEVSSVRALLRQQGSGPQDGAA
jgi:Clp amino terminal domain, pathogenicity island component/UvrB/uvrC motif